MEKSKEHHQHQRDLLEVKLTVESRIKNLDTAGFDKEETEHRKEELNLILRKFIKIISTRVNPIESISTVRGTTFKIGDKFHIEGDELSTYTIILFPDTVTIRGQAENPAMGKPWICEVYVESAHKVKKVKEKKKKSKRLKLEDKQITLVKEGEYFAAVTNNTIYQAIKVKKGKVTGTNELKSKNAPKLIKTEMFGLILKTKKQYKKQIKAERKYKK